MPQRVSMYKSINNYIHILIRYYDICCMNHLYFTLILIVNTMIIISMKKRTIVKIINISKYRAVVTYE